MALVAATDLVGEVIEINSSYAARVSALPVRNNGDDFLTRLALPFEVAKTEDVVLSCGAGLGGEVDTTNSLIDENLGGLWSSVSSSYF